MNSGRSRHVFVGWVCLILGLASSSQGQLSLLDQQVDKATGTQVEVVSVFDQIPPSGHLPLRVTVRNRSGKDLRWRLDSASSVNVYRGNYSAKGRFVMDVPAGTTRTGSFIAPLAVNYSSIGYSGNSVFEVTASNASMGNHSNREYSERAEEFPSLAMSKALAAATLTKLEDELEKRMKSAGRHGSSHRVFAGRFDPKQLPEDWLGYSGLDFLLMRPADWEQLNPAQRLAILHWVRFGGGLHLYKVGKPNLKDLGIEGVKGTRQDRSQGELAMFQWSGKDLDSKAVVSRYWGKATKLKALREAYSSGSWGLKKALGARSFAAWQVLVFLAIFGVLVGPVNLFVLAPPGKRHKLFITTPILSVGASMVMVGIILLQDGTGGEGRRLTVIELQSQDAAAYVTQEQVSRTGVLTSSGFELSQPALIQPLALPESPWTKLTHTGDSQSLEVQLEGLDVAGTMFQSRAEQAQVLQTPVSTRARIELKRGQEEGDAPTIVSALGFAVNPLFYVDPEGQAWKAEETVTAGREVTLIKAESKEWSAWHKSMLNAGGAKAAKHLKAGARSNRGRFFATAQAAPGFTQPTLPSIRWDDDQVAVFGLVQEP